MRFSIITVSLNAETLIERTLSSILKQSFSDYEIIIKDGMSIDQTIQYIPDDTRIKVYVKPDNGIYDAMNQAIDKSSGDYLIIALIFYMEIMYQMECCVLNRVI